ncbi:MAG: metallophosphoesterase [Bacteroidales bacterium]|nr:metallophosphoesterase [Bacteroidales bacterium]MCF8390011.1 metallophosphoesterase [Bacteroidales bacterium]
MKPFLFNIALCAFLLFQPQKVCSQADSSYSFIAAGHAYGAHTGGNTGLHPAFLNSLHSGYDSSLAFIVFTGDIVNESTLESWQQVEDELSDFPFGYYYVMGNHDDNAVGYQEFQTKFGATHYSYYVGNDLFIVLNSVESGRSISPDQIVFLQEELKRADTQVKNVFVFFHEVLWNSNERYKDVRSNSRSRYDQIKEYSNYWEEVHPLLLAESDKRFYLITGDVGGNPDAIAAFYDNPDNVTLISSGMGEVADENYLLVRVHENDSVSFDLVALNPDMDLQELEFYSIPCAPGAISGPNIVFGGSTSIEYSVPEVFNADSYFWDLPEGVSGSSSSSIIVLDFANDYSASVLSVSAVKDGFGKGPATSLTIQPDFTNIPGINKKSVDLKMDIVSFGEFFKIRISGITGNEIQIQISDISGRIIFTEFVKSSDGEAEKQFTRDNSLNKILVISVFNKNQLLTKKFSPGLTVND